MAKYEDQCLFAITADYRPDNENKPIYYVLAPNRRKAKTKFKETITWLKIYDCIRIRQENKIQDIMEHPEKHIIIK